MSETSTLLAVTRGASAGQSRCASSPVEGSMPLWARSLTHKSHYKGSDAQTSLTLSWWFIAEFEGKNMFVFFCFYDSLRKLHGLIRWATWHQDANSQTCKWSVTFELCPSLKRVRWMKNKGITPLGFDEAAYARSIKTTVGVATSRAQNND